MGADTQGLLKLLVCDAGDGSVVASCSVPFSSLDGHRTVLPLKPALAPPPAAGKQELPQIVFAARRGNPPVPRSNLPPAADQPVFADLVTRLEMRMSDIPQKSTKRVKFEREFLEQSAAALKVCVSSTVL